MRNDAYRRLQRQIEAEVSGQLRTVSRNDALAFQARYQELNQRVVQRYGLAEGAVLLDEPSGYPELVDYSAMPQLLAERLTYYQQLAKAKVPTVETISMRIYNQIKQVKASLKRAARSLIR